jgi:ABC-type nitrate/sulfonate/bicarbonate transport system substrate-binding protein
VVHVAMERGIFARHGLEVEATYTPGSLYLSDALRTGRCEIGHTGADDVIADVESYPDSDLFLFMGLHSGLLDLVSAPRIEDIEALRGKNLAVDARTSGFVFILEKALRTYGFSDRDYTFVEVGGWESRYQTLIEGKCAATLLTPPYTGKALAAGCRVLLRGARMMPVYQATCGATSRKWAAENTTELVNYIRAYIEATQWCFDRQNRRACLRVLSQHNGISGAAAEQTLNALLDRKYGLYPKAELNIPGINAAIELRAEMGFLQGALPSVEKYVDLSYYGTAVGSTR